MPLRIQRMGRDLGLWLLESDPSLSLTPVPNCRHVRNYGGCRRFPLCRVKVGAVVPRSRTTLRIGVSGWRYSPWRGVFYPEDLPQRLELWYASRILPTIEINGSFYSLQRPSSYDDWYAAAAHDFVFAV